MPRITLQNLGSMARERRGSRGLREVAKEIETSPATLSRIEGGKLPDLTTFTKLCRWLEVDPSEILGVTQRRDTLPSLVATAHLKADQAIAAETARALANVILRAQAMLADLPEGSGGARV